MQQSTSERQLCACGCGRPTNPVRVTCHRRGYKAGEYHRYLPGHHGRKDMQLIERDCGYATSCLLWPGTTNPWGYGMRRWPDGDVISAHRWYWQMERGPIPKGMQLHHLCGQKTCVNLAHLEMVSAVEHKRRHSKLTTEQIREIKNAPQRRGVGAELARRFGVSQTYVSKIRRGEFCADIE